MSFLVSIITPTYHQRDTEDFRRMLASVRTQTYPHWEHLIVSDGEYEPGVARMVGESNTGNGSKVHYLVAGKHHGGFGAGVRQEAMAHARGKYLVFLDDDNILLPDYLAVMVDALKREPQARWCICRIAHFGPLHEQAGTPPCYLRGEPRVHHIDTLQVMVETEAMRAVGWQRIEDYCADGYTFEALAARAPFTRVEQCLAIHL